MTLYFDEIPVLLIAFNRPKLFLNQLNVLRQFKPKKIYVSIDGPRPGKDEDYQKVIETKNSLDVIDWPCELFTKFESKNLGCKNSVIKAIDWIFEKEEMAIILEDDIIPNESFFRYCANLLEKLKGDSRVFAISGFNCLAESPKSETYRYSAITHVWGWATWRDSWQQYPRDFNLNDVPPIKTIKNFFECTWLEAALIHKIFSMVANEKLDTWDYQLVYLAMKTNMLCATSNFNFIENIGFNAEATHTRNIPDYLLPVEDLVLPIKHPNFTKNKEADKWILKNAYGIVSYKKYLRNRIFSLVIAKR